MNQLYNTGIRLYAAAARLASARSPKIQQMLAGQKENISRIRSCEAARRRNGFDIWFHAASLGEFEQARPLIERYRRDNPDHAILLTFFSPSGYNVRKDYDKVDCVAYLPFDTPKAVRDFLNNVYPRKAVFVKYEFWGNFISQTSMRGIPVILIDAIFRPGQIFFKSWGGEFRNILHCYEHIYVQDEASRRLLASIGIDRVTVAGDTRFDRVTDIMRTTVSLPSVERWLTGADMVVVAGSSWAPDEQKYIPWLNTHPQVKAIIAPHEFDRDRLSRLQSQIQGKSMLWSRIGADGDIPADVQTIIIDSFGLLSSLYRYGDIAIVGGGFGAGIHNINEAAVYGIPVLFGPRHEKFKEAADLIECGGAFEYNTAADISGILDRALADKQWRDKASKAAGSYISSHLGASDRIYPSIIP